MNTRIFIGVAVLASLAIGGIYLLFTKPTSPEPVSEKNTIVTSFYPLEYLTERIVGDLAEVVNIGQNSDPHGYTPSVKDLLTLESADLVLLQGAGLESWASDIERQLEAKHIPIYVMSEHITMYEGGEGETEVELEDEHDHEEEHSHEGQDPHTWLDPVLALDMVSKLTEELVLIDPQHQASYEENATILISELRVIDLAYKNGLANCRVDEALVSHDALGYLSRRYNLTMHPIAGLSTEDEPSAKFLAENNVPSSFMYTKRRNDRPFPAGSYSHI